MIALATTLPPLWPLALYVALIFVVAGAILTLSWALGQRHKEPQTGEPYESGIVSFGSARLRWSVSYYLVAMLFVVFDLEAVFLMAWAIALRDAGWAGFVEALIFVAVLAAALVYLWREGALDSAGGGRVGKARQLPRAADRAAEGETWKQSGN